MWLPINKSMKALIIMGSLKSQVKDSNSAYLSEIAKQRLLEQGFVDVELVNLRDLTYDPGVSNVGDHGADDMTVLLAKTLEVDCVVLATPIWWGLHSSLIQSFMERMCFFDNYAIETNINPMYGKTFGVIVSGSDDGFQQITGLLLNFATNLGFTVPPDAVLPSTQQSTEEIDTDERTQQHLEIFARNLYQWTSLLKTSNIGKTSQASKETRPAYKS